jgi:hypothetical protein
MMMTSRPTIVAVLAAAMFSSVAACDSLADLIGRLNVDTVHGPRGRTSTFVAVPTLLRLKHSAQACASRHAAPLACARTPAFSLQPLTAGRAALCTGSAFGGAFWGHVESNGNNRSPACDVSSWTMRSSAGAKRIQVPCVRSTVRSNKPSHQVRFCTPHFHISLLHFVLLVSPHNVLSQQKQTGNYPTILSTTWNACAHIAYQWRLAPWLRMLVSALSLRANFG